jgi:hypothetical protein
MDDAAELIVRSADDLDDDAGGVGDALGHKGKLSKRKTETGTADELAIPVWWSAMQPRSRGHCVIARTSAGATWYRMGAPGPPKQCFPRRAPTISRKLCPDLYRRVGSNQAWGWVRSWPAQKNGPPRGAALATPSSSEAIRARAPVRGWTSRHIGRCRSQPIHSIPEGRDLAKKFERLWRRGAECIPAAPRVASFHWVALAIVLETARRPSLRRCSASRSTVTGNSSVIRSCGTATRDWPRGPKYVSVRPISQRPDLYRLVGTL